MKNPFLAVLACFCGVLSFSASAHASLLPINFHGSKSIAHKIAGPYQGTLESQAGPVSPLSMKFELSSGKPSGEIALPGSVFSITGSKTKHGRITIQFEQNGKQGLISASLHDDGSLVGDWNFGEEHGHVHLKRELLRQPNWM